MGVSTLFLLILDRHTPESMRNPPQAVKNLDLDDCTLKFQAHKKQFRLPFYLVCDFESFLTPADKDEYYDRATRLIDEHRVCGFARHRVTDIEQYKTDPMVYSGPEPMSVFYDHVLNESKIIGEILKKKQKDMLPLSNEQQTKYKAATNCTACGTNFSAKNHKVRHHCHISGKFLYPACNNCNLQLKNTDRKRKPTLSQNSNKKPKLETDKKFFLSVVFHNLKSYDGHFVIKHLKKEYTERKKVDGKSSTYDDVVVTSLNSENMLCFK